MSEITKRHTQTPWKAGKHADTGSPVVRCGNEDIVAEVATCDTLLSLSEGRRVWQSAINAEFIVNACNNFEWLMSLVEKAYDKLSIADDIVDPADGCMTFCDGLLEELEAAMRITCGEEK